MKIQSFLPIINKDSKILILGTMPGNESLIKNEYYAHPNNHFWDIIFRCLIDDYPKFNRVQETETYQRKVELLQKNKIALWDILKFCDRKGNLDKDIRNEVENDFNAFFHENEQISFVIFNGRKPLIILSLLLNILLKISILELSR